MPVDAKKVIANIVQQEWYSGQIAFVVEVPAREAGYASISPPFPQQIEEYLVNRNIQLYRHQAEVVQKVRDGKNVVLVTATASGKTMAFTLPVFERLLTDPDATALYLYPMKALAYDQLKTLRAMEREMGVSFYTAVYDGDTPKSERGRIRSRSRLILSNPHAFHQYLCWHRLWERFFRSLKYVVIDEAHWYRGIFGSNVAFLIRRLRRVLSYYGSDPQFILASATMADPQKHARRLVGKDFEVVDKDSSTRGKKTYIFWDTDAHPSRSEHIQAADVFALCVANGLQTLCFTISRKMAELTARWAGQSVKGIAAYRAGFLPEERRKLEQDLRQGRLRGIATTNALELGVDIGGLDAVVIAGWPGTVASFRQQAGRAGRSGQESLVVQLLYRNPLDGYLLRNANYLFDTPSEQAVISLDNEYILQNHLKCAAEELPLSAKDQQWFGPGYVDAVRSLFKKRKLTVVVKDAGEKGLKDLSSVMRYTYTGKRACAEVKLTDFDDGEMKLVYEGKILEKLSRRRAFLEAHPGAIYLHQTEPYIVRKFDAENGIIAVEHIEDDLYTTTLSRTDIEIKKVNDTNKHGSIMLSWGKVTVSEKVSGYILKKYSEVVSREELNNMPPVQYDTTAVWCRFDRPQKVPGDFAGGLHAAEHALTAVVPLMAMCDRWDVGGVSMAKGPGGSPVIFIYDGFPGGVGIAERLYRNFDELVGRAVELVKGCKCEGGCPRCIMSPKCGSNNEPLDKRAGIGILNLLKNR